VDRVFLVVSSDPVLDKQAPVGAQFFGGFAFHVDRAEELRMSATQL
jgi:hypothetical protein